MTPQSHAAQIFHEVIESLTSDGYNLENILRRCQFACTLLGKDDSEEWFKKELNGYPQGTAPDYRFATGKHEWIARGYREVQRAVQEMVRGERDPNVDDEPATLEVFAGVHWLIGVLASGYSEPTGETKSGRLIARREGIQLDRYRVFPAASFIRVEKAIATIVYDFACSSYVQIHYGNMISDIWTDYRVSVDAAIGNLGMDQHLKAIQTGLQTENPESWRAAVFECRNLLDDVANHLWQDERDFYDCLPGSANGRLDVSEGKSKNRFAAYLHQKGLYGTNAKFVRDEAERLWGSIGTLVEYQSTAHSPVGREQARSIALGTYFLLGELTIRTDLQPVMKYGTPQIQAED